MVPLVIFVIALNAYPIVYAIWLSLTDFDLSRQTANFVGLQTYARVLSDPFTFSAIMVTLRFTAEAVVLNLLLGLGIALLLNETFRGRGVLRMIALLPWAMSTYAVATLYRFLYGQDIGLFSSFLYALGFTKSYINFLSPEHAIEWVAVAFSWNLAPLGAFFLLAGLQVIPEDLYRQAKVDGAGSLRRFWHITIPHLRHALLIVLLIVTIFAATETTLILTLTGGGPGISTQTLTYWIFAQTFRNYDIAYGAALSWVLIIIVLVIGIAYYLVLMRTRGAKRA